MADDVIEQGSGEEVTETESSQETTEEVQTTATTEETASEETQAEEIPGQSDLPPGVTKTEDGQLTFQVGSSVYKGKDQSELWSNVSAGITEKDATIARFKAKESVTIPDNMKHGPVKETEEAPVPPDRKAIYTKHRQAVTQRYNVDTQKFDWSREQWREYADNAGMRDAELIEEKMDVRRAKEEMERAADLELAEANQLFLNTITINDETEKVQELLVEAGIDASQFDYHALLQKVWADPKAKNQAGLLKSGSIATAAAREIMRIAGKKQVATAVAKKEDDIARGSVAKSQVKTPPASATRHRPPEKEFKSYADVSAEVRKNL